MKIVAISDTHGQHYKLKVPKGDIIFHCGDFMSSGNRITEIIDFASWFSSLPHTHKICIAGNHDLLFEQHSHYKKILTFNNDIIYLENEYDEIKGLRIFGSPYTPNFNNWAFMKPRNSQQLKRIWNFIDEKVDILVTHGPAFDMLDKNKTNESCGCELLKQRIEEVKPRYHIFGHIHHSYGKSKNKDTKFYNCSALNDDYKLVNNPVTFTIKK